MWVVAGRALAECQEVGANLYLGGALLQQGCGGSAERVHRAGITGMSLLVTPFLMQACRHILPDAEGSPVQARASTRHPHICHQL